MKKSLFAILLLVAAAFLVHWANPTFWSRATASFRPSLEGVTIFTGDSLTAEGNFSGLADPHVNHGMKGDTAAGVLRRLATISIRKPKRILLMIGTNDLARGYKVARIVEDVSHIIEMVQLDSPDTQFLLQSVLPVRTVAATRLRNERILELNSALDGLARERGVDFLDLHSAFTDDQGELSRSFTHDGLHLTAEGYARWRAQLAARL